MKKRLIVFFINNIKINSCTSLTGGWGGGGGGALHFKVILVGTGVQLLNLRKHPNAYIAIK